MTSMPSDYNPQAAYIYALCEPGTEQVRYIGQSVNPAARLAQHIYQACSTASPRNRASAWLRDLVNTNQVPNLLVLETTDRMTANDSEADWIRSLLMRGTDLLNGCADGFYIKIRRCYTPGVFYVQSRILNTASFCAEWDTSAESSRGAIEAGIRDCALAIGCKITDRAVKDRFDFAWKIYQDAEIELAELIEANKLLAKNKSVYGGEDALLVRVDGEEPERQVGTGQVGRPKKACA